MGLDSANTLRASGKRSPIPTFHGVQKHTFEGTQMTWLKKCCASEVLSSVQSLTGNMSIVVACSVIVAFVPFRLSMDHFTSSSINNNSSHGCSSSCINSSSSSSNSRLIYDLSLCWRGLVRREDSGWESDQSPEGMFSFGSNRSCSSSSRSSSRLVE